MTTREKIIDSSRLLVGALIESDGGTGPLMSRQPVEAARFSVQVPNPAGVVGKDEHKAQTNFRPLIVTSGLFVI